MQYAKINSVGTGQNFNSLNEMLGFFGFENESIAIRNFAMRGDTKSIKHLLEFDVDIFQKSSNKDDKGCNIAHAAALANQPEVLEYLHEIKADLNVLNDNHSTPLHVAASFLNLEAIKQLVIAKADLNMVNRDNLTPLDLAWNSSIHKSSNRSDFDENKFQHILSLLINNGAKHSLKQDNPSGPP
jgi:ankyrin repeat protein